MTVSDERNKLEQTLKLAIDTFIRSSPGPWLVEENRNMPVNNNKLREFKIKDANGNVIVNMTSNGENARLIMKAVASFPEFIQTLKSILDAFDEDGELKDGEEKG